MEESGVISWKKHLFNHEPSRMKNAKIKRMKNVGKTGIDKGILGRGNKTAKKNNELR